MLERRLDGNTTHDTYYVYDIYGNLRYVLQPMYQEAADLAKYAFQYTYDNRNRCTRKQMPGTEHVEYVYDNYDRLTFSQDGKQRTAGRWSYYLYDKFNRLTVQGECTGKNASSSPTVHVRNYYDNYDFAGTTGFPTTQFTKETSGYGKGMLTGSEYTVFSGTSTGGKIYEAHYYDAKGREVKSVRSNLLGGYEVTETAYSFTGNPLTVTHRHTATGKTAHTEVYTYTYDHADRVSKVEHTLDGKKVTLADCQYDDLGRLKQKNLHGSATNRLNYVYNLRGWLTGISSDRFTQSLYYNKGTGTPCYNGNISSMTWKAGTETAVRGYKYAYDGLGRLTGATYGETPDISTNLNRFNESMTYDRNGNITALQRRGQLTESTYGPVNNLTYTLDGNRLTRVDDAETATAYNGESGFKDAVKQPDEYAYDANGNLTKDLNKGILNIEYNCLNLPAVITFDNTIKITYTYATDGTKLRTLHSMGNGTVNITTDYCGSAVYEYGGLKLWLTSEGYVIPGTTPQYCYYLKDHQGNNRVVIDQTGEVKETTHYYPFGCIFARSGNVQPYKYNGKEYDAKRLNWHDYGARHYDAALGRWHTVDPMAEKYYSTSPYGYCLNNPVKYIDTDGQKVYFATGVSEQFKRDFAMAVQHLNLHGAAGMLAQLEKSEKVYYIAESTNNASSFDFANQTITWASRHGLLTENLIILSATSILNHEIDHALQFDQNPEQQRMDKNILTDRYKNKEEQRVIEGSEQETARKLGEIEENQITRENHNGTLYEMTSPISIEIKEIVITPKSKSK